MMESAPGGKKGGGKDQRRPTPATGRDKSSDKNDAIPPAELPLPPWLSRSLGESTILSALEKVDVWDFDVFALDQITNHRPLVVGGMYMIQRLGLLDKIPIPRDKLVNYLDKIEQG